MSWWPSFKEKVAKNFAALTPAQTTSMCPTIQDTIKDFAAYQANPILGLAAVLNDDLGNFWIAVPVPGTSMVGGLTKATYPITDQQMFEFLQTNAKEMQDWLQQLSSQYCSAASPSPASPASSSSSLYLVIGIISLVILGAVLAFALMQK